MTVNNDSEIKANLERAETNLQAAKKLLGDGYYDIAASRAYYAAFYVASALLLKENFDTSKHSGVIALIHQHFVKSGKLNREQGKNLNWLFELRGVGDYGVSVHVASEEAFRSVQVAEIFMNSARVLLGM